MTRQTIKDLEGQIETLRELRESDRQAFVNERNKASFHEAENKRLLGEISRIQNDLRWFRRLAEVLAMPQQERTRF